MPLLQVQPHENHYSQYYHHLDYGYCRILCDYYVGKEARKLMFRSFAVKLNTQGTGTIDLSPYVESVEWDIYQISVQTTTNAQNCSCELRHNNFFLCGTINGSKDTAYGPPDIVVQPSDIFTIMWFNGKANDQATAGVWYNENRVGTTYSTAH